MITEAIILAGGMGTRLRESVPGVPKAMAPVASQPFLTYVINTLRMQGIRRFIFSLGYQSDMIREFLQQHYATLDYVCVTEEEPLGTGGAIRLAMEHAGTSHVLVANGDTLFRVNAEQLEDIHLRNNADCTLALKPMQHFDRYGVVETDPSGRIISFREKKFYETGMINGGIYVINVKSFLQHCAPGKFSFETDYLERFTNEFRFYGAVQDAYFIDIGIPADYEKAGRELERAPLDLGQTRHWTLFLDRDGVINDERVGYYVLHWGEFIFSRGVLEVFKFLGDHFGRVIIVSNQRGVGKGLMTREALESIHLEMKREVEIVGGHIDQIYYCTDKEDTSFFRKPNPGMAWQAARDFPDIDFSRAIMVGNKPSDMQFGRSAGMYTVFVKTTNPEQSFPHPDIDLCFDSLSDFARAVEP